MQAVQILLENKKASYVLGDKGYDAKKVDTLIESMGAVAVIPVRSCCHYKRDYPRELYKKRNLIERFFQRLKEFRRLATRYERKAIYFLNMSLVGAIWIGSV